jgi:hypothetical protein
MAVLTRPALLPAAVVIGAVTNERPVSKTLPYWATLMIFVAIQLGLNQVLYGDPRVSGYGRGLSVFEFSRARLYANLSNFHQSLPFALSPLVWVLWPAALIGLRKEKKAWQLSAIAGAAAAPYLFYTVYEGWETLRFLLPAIVIVLILTARTLTTSFPLRQSVFAGPVALAIALVCGTEAHRFLQREGAYRFGDGEAKYPLAGEWIQSHTSQRAVVFAALHSGSLRYYGHRLTVRWDQIPSDKLRPSLRNLVAAGYEPYLALDTASEPPLFEQRFGSDPAIQLEQIGRVRVVNFYRFVSVH